METSLGKIEVYRLAHDLAVRIHAMSLTLPGFERFEEASQIRRSSKRVSACLVEGHTLRKYKALFLSYLYRALASCDETQEHLMLLKDTGSLADAEAHRSLSEGSAELSGKLFRFIQGVERHHEPPHYLTGLPPRDSETSRNDEGLLS